MAEREDNFNKFELMYLEYRKDAIFTDDDLTILYELSQWDDSYSNWHYWKYIKYLEEREQLLGLIELPAVLYSGDEDEGVLMYTAEFIMGAMERSYLIDRCLRQIYFRKGRELEYSRDGYEIIYVQSVSEFVRIGGKLDTLFWENCFIAEDGEKHLFFEIRKAGETVGTMRILIRDEKKIIIEARGERYKKLSPDEIQFIKQYAKLKNLEVYIGNWFENWGSKDGDDDPLF